MAAFRACHVASHLLKHGAWVAAMGVPHGFSPDSKTQRVPTGFQSGSSRVPIGFQWRRNRPSIGWRWVKNRSTVVGQWTRAAGQDMRCRPAAFIAPLFAPAALKGGFLGCHDASSTRRQRTTTISARPCMCRSRAAPRRSCAGAWRSRLTATCFHRRGGSATSSRTPSASPSTTSCRTAKIRLRGAATTSARHQVGAA